MFVDYYLVLERQGTDVLHVSYHQTERDWTHLIHCHCTVAGRKIFQRYHSVVVVVLETVTSFSWSTVHSVFWVMMTVKTLMVKVESYRYVFSAKRVPTEWKVSWLVVGSDPLVPPSDRPHPGGGGGDGRGGGRGRGGSFYFHELVMPWKIS